MSPWKIETFGRDCLGNITGYRVQRHGWKYTGNPHRHDGMSWIVEQAGQFIGDIYVAGSFTLAFEKAVALTNQLNGETK